VRSRARLAGLAVLAVVTIAAFAGVLRNGWILVDDSGYVYENPIVGRGLTLDGVVHFLGHDHGVNWVPVTALSHMLDVQMFGLDPTGHHATSLLIHVFNSLLVVLVLHRLTGAWWRSLAVAALFALHPLRVESVAWIAERKDVLSACFFLLTLLAWVRWTERPGAGRYACVFIAMLLGLWSKPMVITLPFVLLLVDAWPLGRMSGVRAVGWRRLLLEKWPLFALVVVVTVVTYSFQSRAGAVPDSEFFTIGRRLANGLINYWRYLGLMAWPGRLAPFYPHEGGVETLRALAAGAGLLAVTALALRAARRRPYLAFGWLWFLGTLVPAAGFVQTGGHAYADRFTYIPGLGILIAVVWGAGDLVSRRGIAARRSAAIAVGVALAVLVALTLRQTGYWRDTMTYAQRVLEVSGENPLARRVAHRWQGRWLYAEGRVAEAIPHLEQGLGVPPGTEERLRRALARNADDLEARRELAALITRETRVEEGIAEYREILARAPGDPDALVNIAWVRSTHELARHRDGAEAVRLAQQACDGSSRPLAVLFSTLAAALAENGQFAEAVAAGKRAVELARLEGPGPDAGRYAAQLREYEAGRPFHHSF
jgi:tetratricopeptide (TPR) repeat protein